MLSTKICPRAVLLTILSGNAPPSDVLVEPADGADVACVVGAPLGAVVGAADDDVVACAVGALVGAVVDVVGVDNAVVGSTVGKLPSAVVG